jgi:hypothetical protein
VQVLLVKSQLQHVYLDLKEIFEQGFVALVLHDSALRFSTGFEVRMILDTSDSSNSHDLEK